MIYVIILYNKFQFKDSFAVLPIQFFIQYYAYILTELRIDKHGHRWCGVGKLLVLGFDVHSEIVKSMKHSLNASSKFTCRWGFNMFDNQQLNWHEKMIRCALKVKLSRN